MMQDSVARMLAMQAKKAAESTANVDLSSYATTEQMQTVEQKIGDLSLLTIETKLIDDFTYNTPQGSGSSLYSETFNITPIKKISLNVEWTTAATAGSFMVILESVDGQGIHNTLINLSPSSKTGSVDYDCTNLTGSFRFQCGGGGDAAGTASITDITAHSAPGDIVEVLNHLLATNS